MSTLAVLVVQASTARWKACGVTTGWSLTRWITSPDRSPPAAAGEPAATLRTSTPDDTSNTSRSPGVRRASSAPATTVVVHPPKTDVTGGAATAGATSAVNPATPAA